MGTLKNLLAACFIFAAASIQADEIGNKAQTVFSKYKDSIVNVSLILSMEVTYAGNVQPEQEQKIDTKATVFNSDGLLVTAYTNIDPTVAQPQRKVGGKNLTIKSSYKEVKLVTDDGSESPLKVALIDKEQNLAFLALDKEHDDFKEVKLQEAGFNKNVEVKELDQVVSITKLGKNLYRKPMVKIGRISAIIPKPRKRLLCTVGDSGTPIYSLTGEMIGMAIPKLQNGKTFMQIIPVEEIKEISEQANTKS